ncbi:MAG: M23 family metallopeptidase [Bacillus sp. (in: Bacteria)]|nr:M23 family metallopeptidase [Bacillus sp. (in: firmicutes)]MCM1426189.1 M23 family metallopeptidase [Eubacterium sp.]
MKRKGHNHKESFSILLISNTGQRNRQFRITRFASRLLIVLLLIVCVAVGGAIWIFAQNPLAGMEQNKLRAQVDEQTQLMQQLEAEKETLSNELLALRQENESLLQTVEQYNEAALAEAEAAANDDAGIPRRYPTSGTSGRLSSYSEEQPYLAISTHTEGNIVATGNGTITTVTSDDTYPVIVEVEHDKGYQTRYMCRQEAEVQATEGAQVEAGDTLFTITIDDSQLDYQILFEGEPIDPLTVIEAKG